MVGDPIVIILFQGPLLCLVNRYAFEQGLAFDIEAS